MENKIKVLEVLDAYYPKFDGPCLVVTSLSKCFLNSNKVLPSVVVPRFPKYKDSQPFTVFRVKSVRAKEGYYAAAPYFDRKLTTFLKENKPDIIHIHSPFTMGAYFGRYAKKHKIPTVFTFHTKYREDFDRTLKLKCLSDFMVWYIIKNINRIDHVWTVSDGAAECLKEYGYKKPIKVIRNGTDLIYPENADELIKRINDKHALDENELILLSVGRIVENKRLQFALKVLKQVSDLGYKFKYFIVGDGSYLNKLKSLVKEYNLHDKVIFTGSVMNRTELSAYYLRANLFVFPSTFDTASLAPIEAAAMKLPTLMTKGCSSAEIITDGVNGFLTEQNEQAWIDTIIDLLKNREKLDGARENAYKQVYRTWDSVAQEILDNYKEIIKSK